MTIRIRESVLTPISGRGSSFFSGAVHLLNPYVVSPAPVALPLDPIHPVIISPLIVEATPVALPLNEDSISYYLSFGATESLAITEVTPTLVYLADRLHKVFYKSQHFNIHQTSWGTDTNAAQLLHSVSWSLSANAYHTVQYEFWVPSSAWTLHETSWASFGGTTLAFGGHETSWASAGASPALALHETAWASWSPVSAWSFHETLWASLGGSSNTAFKLHETLWNSLGGLTATQQFHSINWCSIDAIQQIHTVLWKSIIADQQMHITAWETQYPNSRLHKARYRSYIMTSTFLDGDFYVRL
jgi:hypothetical protein